MDEAEDIAGDAIRGSAPFKKYSVVCSRVLYAVLLYSRYTFREMKNYGEKNRTVRLA